MHFGNLSLFVGDVLPMMWRPVVHSGELDARPVQPQAQPAGYAALADQVSAWAITDWDRASDLPALSPGLRAASAENARLLKRL
ncbi:MAG: hypothetical protein H7224_10145 [Polaromonas sp.]|nr:hypothetical protein [Polaromonas sp.]